MVLGNQAFEGQSSVSSGYFGKTDQFLQKINLLKLGETRCFSNHPIGAALTTHFLDFIT